jgi:uncharacterized protein (DUF2237 family)
MKKQVKNTILSIILTTLSVGAFAEKIFLDDFQDGDFDSWSSSDPNGSSRIISKNGSLMLNIRNSDSASVTIDTTDISDVVISLDMAAVFLEKGELCFAEAEGVTIGQIGKDKTNGEIVHRRVFNANVFDNNPNLTLVLRAAGNHDSDYCYFDNIVVESIPGGLSRNEATAAYLNGINDHTFSAAAFFPQNNNPTINNFEGSLKIKGTPSFKRLYGWTRSMPAKANQWPKFDVEFVQQGNDLIPVDRRGMQPVHADDAWSVAVGTGAVWDESGDEGMTRAAFPFTLGQRNASCEHNGVATFLFDNAGNISNAHIQTVSETCGFYGFDMYGTLEATYNQFAVSSRAQTINNWNKEVVNHIPTKPLAQLVFDFPGVDLSHYHPKIKAADLHMYGVIVNGINYVDGCVTRYGKHPYCSEMTTSVYSFTKSIFSSLAVMRAEKLWPGFNNESIASRVPECYSSGNWDDVSIENALDMATGNYIQPRFQFDELGFIMKRQFFSQESRVRRVGFACNRLPRKAIPGTRMVSHTSDHELVSYALTQMAIDMLGVGADGFNDIVVPVYDEIGLSHTIRGIRRTTEGDAWGGYGISAKANDIALISKWLASGEAEASNLLDNEMLSNILNGSPQGLYAGLKHFNYDDGFWRYHAGATTSMRACGTDTQVPVMSGFGGHTAVIMPNVIFYQMTDGAGIGFIDTISDIFDNIDNTCP